VNAVGGATASYEERQAAANRNAAERIDERAIAENEAKLESGGIAAANPRERIVNRIDRLHRYAMGEALPVTSADVPSPEQETTGAPAPRKLFARGPINGLEEKDLERIINGSQLLGVRYLEAGMAAARAVGRIDVHDTPEHLEGFGTGSLVSPRLVLTNHHVLPNRDVAAVSSIEFNFQDDLSGKELEPQIFGFDPDVFFVADEERDFALVAVKAAASALEPFGSNPLIEAEGKGVIGEFVSIIQHPGGRRKEVALRENKFIDLKDPFMHYTTDTEPGSSGSPVFNDQWEIVALHHAGIDRPESKDTGGIINEGIVARRITEFVRALNLTADQRALADQITPRERIPATSAASAPEARSVGNGAGSLAAEITVPLELTIQLRSPGATMAAPVALAQNGAGAAAPMPIAAAPTAAPAEEKVEIDPDYKDRKGYDAGFLGSGSLRVDLPTLSDGMLDKVSINTMASSEPRYVLPYHHYSVVMNKERRLAYFTAVNIDGASGRRLKREPDRWFFDKRIPPDEQTGELVYEHNKLDRGHLVRRLDPAWGTSDAVVKIANDDTFHFTNCTPQHERFNQNKATWAGLEDYILENADNRDFRVNVFSGPVLADDDKEYKGVKLPRQFWKVVTMAKSNGQLSATAYLISQEELLAAPLDEEVAAVEPAFAFGAFRTYQVPITKIEEVTGLSFGPLSSFDPLAGAPLETAMVAREIASPAEVVL
jgi:endonuclease G